MKYFELKDSFKKDDPGNFVFFLSFIAVRCSWEILFMYRKHPYEKYIDFYTSHKDLFLNCDAALKDLIESRMVNDKSYNGPSESSAKTILDEFEKRCINYLEGTSERWGMMLSSVFGFFIFLLSLGGLAIHQYLLSIIFLLVFVYCCSEFWVNLRCFLAITKRVKSYKKQLKWFPFNMDLIYKLMESSMELLSKIEIPEIAADDLDNEEIRLLEELYQEGQISKENGKYYLVGPVKAFLKWLEENKNVYDIQNKFICKYILQSDGSVIKPGTIYQAKSRNKEDEKDFLD